MSESWASANSRRACIDCGESGAILYTARSPERSEGYPTRVCLECLRAGRWDHFNLVPRGPIFEESEYHV